MNAMEKALEAELFNWIDPGQELSRRRVDSFGTTIVVAHERDDLRRYRVIRAFPMAGAWAISVDLSDAEDWQVFDYLLERADES